MRKSGATATGTVRNVWVRIECGRASPCPTERTTASDEEPAPAPFVANAKPQRPPRRPQREPDRLMRLDDVDSASVLPPGTAVSGRAARPVCSRRAPRRRTAPRPTRRCPTPASRSPRACRPAEGRLDRAPDGGRGHATARRGGFRMRSEEKGIGQTSQLSGRHGLAPGGGGDDGAALDIGWGWSGFLKCHSAIDRRRPIRKVV